MVPAGRAPPAVYPYGLFNATACVTMACCLPAGRQPGGPWHANAGARHAGLERGEMMCQTQGPGWLRSRGAAGLAPFAGRPVGDLPLYKKAPSGTGSSSIEAISRRRKPGSGAHFTQETDPAQCADDPELRELYPGLRGHSNLYGALYSVLATDDPQPAQSMRCIKAAALATRPT